MVKQNIGSVPEREHRGIVSALDPESNIRKSRFTFSETTKGGVAGIWKPKEVKGPDGKIYAVPGQSRLAKGSLEEMWAPDKLHPGVSYLTGKGGQWSDGRLVSGTSGQSAALSKPVEGFPQQTAPEAPSFSSAAPEVEATVARAPFRFPPAQAYFPEIGADLEKTVEDITRAVNDGVGDPFLNYHGLQAGNKLLSSPGDDSDLFHLRLRAGLGLDPYERASDPGKFSFMN